MYKKIIALCLICSIFGGSTIASATTYTNSTLNNTTLIQDTISTSNLTTSENVIITEQAAFNPNKMTMSEKRAYNASIDKQVDLMKTEYGKTFDSKSFRQELVRILETKNSLLIPNNVNSTGMIMPLAGSVIPDICIKNVYVAAAISVIIDATLIAAGVGSVSLFVKKVGKAEAKKIFTRTITSKLKSMGCAALAASFGTVVNYIFYLLDPGKAGAAFLDSRDVYPNNGYLNVIL